MKHEKINFEYAGDGEYTATYRGIDIKVEHDEYAENPWESWDGNAPILVSGMERHHAASNYGNIDTDTPALTKTEIKENICRLKNVLETSSLLTFVKDSSYYGTQYGATETLNDAISEYFTTLCISDQFDVLETLYNIKGTPALSTSVSGYSQGDYRDMLIVLTDEFFKETGRKKEDAKQIMEAARSLYESWAFGDVYNYTIEETEDSCGGFYGDDFNTNGLTDYAIGAIDHYLNGLVPVIRMHCEECGSQDIDFKQITNWNVAKQEFQMLDFSDENYCRECGDSDVSVVDISSMQKRFTTLEV